MHGPLACAAWLAAGGGAVRACSKAGGRRRGRARPCPPASGGQRRGLRSHPRWLGQIRRRPAVPFPPTRTPTRSPISAGTSSLTCHARRRQELHAEPPPRPRSALVDPKNRLLSSPWCSSPLPHRWRALSPDFAPNHGSSGQGPNCKSPIISRVISARTQEPRCK